MHSITLIIPYFGKWPVWFEAHLLSIAHNPTIDWLFITDCEVPQNHPANVRFVPSTLETLNSKVNNILEMEVPLSARKLCDIKPAYGIIFQEYISGYDFWGFCDVDIIWGDIRKFMTPQLLTDFDIIASRPEAISGHFTLFRNVEGVNNFFKTIPNYKELFEKPKFMWVDEHKLTNHLKYLDETNKNPFRVFWDAMLVKNGIESERHQEYYLDRWLFKEGKVFDLFDSFKKEYMYLHFINWKRTMKFCKIKYSDNPNQFYISYNGIHYQPHSRTSRILNDFKNLFNGYYSILFRKRLVKKISKNLNKKV